MYLLKNDNDSKVKLSLFNRTGIKNYNIEHFNFEQIDSLVESKILESIKTYQKDLEDYEPKNYDHVVAEKERKTLEYLDFQLLYESSLLFKTFLELLINNSISSTFMDANDIEHTINTRLNDMERLSFFVIQTKDIDHTTFYFKRFSFNSLFLRKNILLKVRDATKLNKLDEKYLNLDTNFDFYFSIPNDVNQGRAELAEHESEVYIKNSANFETILNFREIYDNHRDHVIEMLKEYDVVSNIDAFLGEFRLARHRRKYIRINYEEEITEPLKHIDENIIDSLESQTDSIEVIKNKNQEISFKINSSEGVEILLNMLGEHVLMAFDLSLQQVLSKSPIK